MKALIVSLFVEPVAVVLTLTFWYALVSIALRAFGIRLPVIIWRYSLGDTENQLSRFRFIVVQAILWGGWFYLSEVVEDLTKAKFSISAPFHAPGYSVFHAVSSLVLGVWFGSVMWKNSPRANPYAHFDRLSINPEARD
jgi:hypothetical protein